MKSFIASLSIIVYLFITLGAVSAQKKKKAPTNNSEPLRMRCKSENPTTTQHNMSGIAYLDANICFFDAMGEPLPLTTDGTDGYTTKNIQSIGMKYQLRITGLGYAAVFVKNPQQQKWLIQGLFCKSKDTTYTGALASTGVTLPDVNNYYTINSRKGGDVFMILLSSIPLSCNELKWVDSIASDYGSSFGRRVPVPLGAARLERLIVRDTNAAFRSINVSSTDGGWHYAFVYCRIKK